MEFLVYNWIGSLAVSPLVFILSACILGIFHSFKKYWRSVDLFLTAIFVQELLVSLQIFIYSLLSLLKPSEAIGCGMFVWSFSATKTLQSATVTSLLIDRALTSQWPYKYRFSVRRHQIRYHLVVLATMASLVGVAAILVRSTDGENGQSFEKCSFLPHSLHIRLALFLLALYGIMAVISAISVCVVQATRGCGKVKNSICLSANDISPIANGTTGSSTTTGSSGVLTLGKPLRAIGSSASTTSSTSGILTGGLHSASSTTNLFPPHSRPNYKRRPKILNENRFCSSSYEFRWCGTFTVAFICFITNHLPYIGLIILGTFFPTMLPEWPLEILSLWLSLLEGLLLPFSLWLTDSTFREAAVRSRNKRYKTTLDKKNGISSSSIGIFQKEDVKAFPLTNGSLFSSFVNLNGGAEYSGYAGYGNRTDGHSEDNHLITTGLEKWRFPHMSPDRSEPPQIHRSLDSIMFGSRDQKGMPFSVNQCSNGIIYSIPLNKGIGSDVSLKTSDDDHIYATLSETFGSFSSISNEFLEENRCSSATTVANDDFVFHCPRSDGKNDFSSATDLNHIRNLDFVDACNTALTSTSPNYFSRPVNTNTGKIISLVDSDPKSDKFTVEHIVSDVPSEVEMRIINHRSSPRLGFVNEAFEDEEVSNGILDNAEKAKKYISNKNPEKTVEIEQKGNDTEGYNLESKMKSLSKEIRSSSLSMNDLDQIGGSELDNEKEMMFVLPVKSESMLNLYKLYLSENDSSGVKNLRYSLELSKSEGSLSALKENSFQGNESNVEKNFLATGGSYQKKRSSPPASSRQIKRQTKIQKAKYLSKKCKPTTYLSNSEYKSNIAKNLREDAEQPSKSSNFSRKLSNPKDWCQDEDAFKESSNIKKSGIITIDDPSVLSVEDLLKVLNRASKSRTDSFNSSGQTSSTSRDNNCQSVKDYKKIFVSEYL